MNREKAIEKLKKQQQNGDTEVAHQKADRVLCKLLKQLGYGDVVKEWQRVKKWFA